jgi:hypothetical protein
MRCNETVLLGRTFQRRYKIWIIKFKILYRPLSTSFWKLLWLSLRQGVLKVAAATPGGRLILFGWIRCAITHSKCVGSCGLCVVNVAPQHTSDHRRQSESVTPEFKVFRAVLMMMQLFWGVMSCLMINGCRSIRYNTPQDSIFTHVLVLCNLILCCGDQLTNSMEQSPSWEAKMS